MEVQMVKETGGEEHRFSMKDPIKRKNSQRKSFNKSFKNDYGMTESKLNKLLQK